MVYRSFQHTDIIAVFYLHRLPSKKSTNTPARSTKLNLSSSAHCSKRNLTRQPTEKNNNDAEGNQKKESCCRLAVHLLSLIRTPCKLHAARKFCDYILHTACCCRRKRTVYKQKQGLRNEQTAWRRLPLSISSFPDAADRGLRNIDHCHTLILTLCNDIVSIYSDYEGEWLWPLLTIPSWWSLYLVYQVMICTFAVHLPQIRSKHYLSRPAVLNLWSTDPFGVCGQSSVGP